MGSVLSFLFLLLSVAHSSVFVLSSENNEGAFSVKGFRKGFCFVGRRDTERGYDAVLGVCGNRCRVFSVDTSGEDYSYTVQRFAKSCLAGIVRNKDMALAVFDGRGVHKLLCLGGEGEDMLWFMRKVEDGYLLVGGVLTRDWDVLVVKLSPKLSLNWWVRLGTTAHEYAYGVAEWRGRYWVVGRSNYRGNWDGFVLELSSEGKLLSSSLFGSDRKDYLRYVGVWRGELLAVGRSEVSGDSDVLLLLPRSGLFKLYDGGEDDYGRAFEERHSGLVVVGDTYENGVSDGMVLFLDGDLRVVRGFAVGGEDVESIRFVSGGFFAGYTYSLTFDNDIVLGELEKTCGGFFREKSFRERSGFLKSYGYPLELRDYGLRVFECEFSWREASFEKLNPCQE